MESYRQHDPRWAMKPYAGETMKSAGCGPTSVADVLGVSPVEIADYMTSHGYASNGSGTYHSGIYKTFEHYGYTASKITSGSLAGKVTHPLFEDFKKHIQGGHCGVILTGGVGTGCRNSYWCYGGHYIACVGYKDGKYLIYDPYTASHDGYHDWADLAGNVKHLFITSVPYKKTPIITDTKAVSGTATVLKTINTRSKYDWSEDAKMGVSYPGEIHQVVEFSNVDGSPMYKTTRGLYISGGKAYVLFKDGLDKKIEVSGHCQTYGNLPKMSNGCLVGTVGEGKRLEGFTIHTSIPMKVEVYCQKDAWHKPVKNNEYAGTKGESKRLEAFRILRSDGGDVHYRAFLEGMGWTAWRSNGAKCGTTGDRRRIEAIQIKV